MPASTDPQPDPFGATFLWERIVAHLERTVRIGKHNIGLRSYDSCFHGSKAVDALVSYLNTILPKTVKRSQAVVLCEKLLETGVIEPVKEKREFREKGLYRFTFSHFWDSPQGSCDSDDMVSSLKQPALSKCRSMELIQNEGGNEQDASPASRTDLRFPIDKGYASDSTVTLSTHHHKKKAKKSKIPSPRIKLSDFTTLTKQKLQSVAKRLHTERPKIPTLKVSTPPVHPKPQTAKQRPDIPTRCKSQRSTSRLAVKPDEEKTKRRHSSGAQVRAKEYAQREPVTAGRHRQECKKVRRSSKVRERNISLQSSRQWPQVSDLSMNISLGVPAVLNCSGMNRSHSFSSCGELYDLAQVSDSSSGHSRKWIAYGFV